MTAYDKTLIKEREEGITDIHIFKHALWAFSLNH